MQINLRKVDYPPDINLIFPNNPYFSLFQMSFLNENLESVYSNA